MTTGLQDTRQARRVTLSGLETDARIRLDKASTTDNRHQTLSITWALLVFCSGVPLTFVDLSALIQGTEHAVGLDILSSVLGDLVQVASVRYLVFGAGIFIAVGALRSLSDVSRLVGPWLLTYTVWASISVAWSSNTALAAVKVISLWSAIIVAVALRSRAGESSAVAITFMKASAAVLLSSILIAVVSPEFGVMGPLGRYARLGGEYVYPNTLGQYAGMLLVLVWGWPTGWRKPTLVGLSSLCLIVLLLTQSRTSLVAALIALLMVMLLTVHVAARAATIGFAAVLLLGVAIADVDLEEPLGFFGRGSSEELRDMATIRVDVWKDAVERGANRPLVGHGFATGSRLLLSPQRFRSGYGWQPMHSHNAFVETYLNLGVVGVVLLVILVGSIGVNLLRVRRAGGPTRARATAAVGLLTFVLVVGLTESSFAGELGQAFVGLLVCAVVGAERVRAPDPRARLDAETAQPS